MQSSDGVMSHFFMGVRIILFSQQLVRQISDEKSPLKAGIYTQSITRAVMASQAKARATTDRSMTMPMLRALSEEAQLAVPSALIDM